MTTDARTRAIEALAEALHEQMGRLTDHTGSVCRYCLDDATIAVHALDAHPEAKAALAAWLAEDVMDALVPISIEAAAPPSLSLRPTTTSPAAGGLRDELKRAREMIEANRGPHTPDYKAGWLDAIDAIRDDPALASSEGNADSLRAALDDVLRAIEVWQQQDSAAARYFALPLKQARAALASQDVAGGRDG